MKHYHRITSQERDRLAYWHATGVGIREIARRLGRSHSSVSDEMKRNTITGIYGSIQAHKLSEIRKRSCHKKYLLSANSILQNFVIEKLKLGWSPQQIAGRLKKEIREGIRPEEEYINHESIYQYIYDDKQKEQELFEYLPRAHKKRRRWLGRKSMAVKIPHRVSIRYRGVPIENRQEFGHYEGDTIVGDKHKTGIHTEVERVSRYLFAFQIPHIRSQETCLAQLGIFSSLPKEARKSTTLDNGSENYQHTRLQEELGMQTFFADPYSSWQRGTNEYHNGLIRRYFPKGTDFRLLTQEELNEIVHRINNTPRKVLEYKTPFEVFTALLSVSGRIYS